MIRLVVDYGAYLLALATALIGGTGGYIGSVLRTRAGGRTAARLVHAELLQNAASVLYYRDTARLVAPTLRRNAWDAHSEALAKLREPGSFTAISDSYQALEGITYLASAGSDEVPAELLPLLEVAIARLSTGLAVCGRLAGLDETTILGQVGALGPRPDEPPDAADAPPAQGPLAIFTISAVVEDRLRLRVATAAAGRALALAGASGTEEGERVHHVWPDRPVRGRPKRLVFDAEHDEELDAPRLVRREGDPETGDVAVDEAYEALGVTYDFFYSVFGLDSYDGRGAVLEAVVHYGRDYDNIFWNGRQFVCGDGDNRVFRRFTRALDIFGHEFWTAVLQYARPLTVAGESGALSQSIADVFGVLVKQYRRQQTVDEADWLFGDAVLVPRPGVRALRSFEAPGSAYDDTALGRDPQPATMAEYVRTSQDNGGVHINSGIPNRAFYLVATELGGYAWERAGRIWYDAVHDQELTPETDFRAFAAATVRAAGGQVGAVTAAWEQVGVRVSS